MAPVLTIIAGPNGSGKTTLTRLLRSQKVDFGIYINPDEIALGLPGDIYERTTRAQQTADELRERCLKEGRDFSFETVMSHPSKVEFLARARETGYDVVLYFVGLEDPRLNVARVRQRVAEGGHAVPEDRIVARYARTMGLLPAAYESATEAAIFDNSGLVTDPNGGIRLVVHKKQGSPDLSILPPVPLWVWDRLLRFRAAAPPSEPRLRTAAAIALEGTYLEEVSPEPSVVASGSELRLVRKVRVDRSRDALLTDFGRTTLEDRYLLAAESCQDMFARVATAFADDADHAQRVYDYMSKLWFMPATPILSNGGTDRGLPISAFLNAVSDSFEGVQSIWIENAALASNGGGIGTYWGGVRSIGEKVKGAGQASGIIPFIRVMDSLTLAISQGSLRRGSAAVYLDIHHPEIDEFLEIRKPSGDFNRKSLNLHHGISISDEFMHAVRDGTKFGLRSPKTGEILREINARALWQKVLELRLQTGEPYLIFSDAVNRAMPKHQRELGLKVRQSNLCSEIMLHTGKDHLGEERTAACCLSSVNAESFLEWRDEPLFIEDVMRFLDNVLEDFIQRAPPEMSRAVYAVKRERSVGLGLMGFHSFLQAQNVPFESALAKSWNMRLFKHLRSEADKASVKLAEEKGPCPDAADRGVMERFSHKLAIAPTASISIICGGTSAGIEPIPANIYTHKTLSGNFAVRNPYLERLLETKGANTPPVWDSILANEGSVQHLECLSADEKDVYKTAFEIDQRWVIELAADRTPDICQSQSVNVFLPGDVDKWDLHMLHWQAWERGMKSLYFLRSKSVQRAGHAGGGLLAEQPTKPRTDYAAILSSVTN